LLSCLDDARRRLASEASHSAPASVSLPLSWAFEELVVRRAIRSLKLMTALADFDQLRGFGKAFMVAVLENG
jgi:hypothetical protein